MLLDRRESPDLRLALSDSVDIARGRGCYPPGVPLLNAYFSFSCAAWIPCAIVWDHESGEFRRVEAQEGFTT